MDSVIKGATAAGLVRIVRRREVYEQSPLALNHALEQPRWRNQYPAAANARRWRSQLPGVT